MGALWSPQGVERQATSPSDICAWTSGAAVDNDATLGFWSVLKPRRLSCYTMHTGTTLRQTCVRWAPD